MADAEDLKSSGDFSSCGFDSHPGHHFLPIFVAVLVNVADCRFFAAGLGCYTSRITRQ
jgi:hypothetical protein